MDTDSTKYSFFLLEFVIHGYFDFGTTYVCYAQVIEKTWVMRKSKLGQNLKTLRNKLGMTMTQLASRSGVSKTSIYRIEAGSQTNVTAETVEALARALASSRAALEGTAPEKEVISMGLVIDFLRALEAENERLRDLAPKDEDELILLRAYRECSVSLRATLLAIATGDKTLVAQARDLMSADNSERGPLAKSLAAALAVLLTKESNRD